MSKNRKTPSVQNTHPAVEEKKIESISKFSTKDYIIALAIALLALMAFNQVKNYEFVNWDDDRNIYENKLITSLSKKNFGDNSKQIFKTKVIGNYNPLSNWSFALEQRLHSTNKSGAYNGIEKPGKWHMTNVYLHMLCIILVYFIARKLGLKIIGAGFVAALFAIHPMRVESVAWVTERKDVLFGFFYLLSMFLYISNKEKASVMKMVGVYLFFILSLFSKIQAVSLPLTLIAVDYLMDKKFTWSSVVNKIGFFLLSLAFGIYGITALSEEGSLDANSNTYPAWQRIFVGSYSFLVYLIKWIVPYRMVPMYPYDAKLPTIFYPTIAMLPITLFALWKGYKNNNYFFVFSFVFFIVNIVFLLQILGAGQGFIADRFTYIAYFGLFFGLGYLLDKCMESASLKFVGIGVAGLMIVAYIFVTMNQVKIWENSATLWTHVAKYYNKTTLPFGNRANYYRAKKMYKEAIADYNSAIALKSEPQTHNSRARLYFDTAGNDTSLIKKALLDYNKAIELSPKDGEFWINRGATYARLGNIDKALENINQGLIYKPDHETGYLNRFVLFTTLAGRYPLGSPQYVDLVEKAILDMSTYQKTRPYEANTWYEKARMKRSLGRIAEAKSDIQKALELEPENNLFKTENAAIQASK